MQLAIRNLWRRPGRTVLLVLTFAVGTFVLTVLGAIPASIDMIMSDTAKTLRLYSYNNDGRYLGLPARYCGAIEQMPGVLGCTPMVFVRATYRDERETIQAYALDADKVATMYPDYK